MIGSNTLRQEQGLRKRNEMKDVSGSDARTRRSSARKEVPHEQGDEDWSRNYSRRECRGRRAIYLLAQGVKLVRPRRCITKLGN